jgi:hypothetical protein
MYQGWVALEDGRVMSAVAPDLALLRLWIVVQGGVAECIRDRAAVIVNTDTSRDWSRPAISTRVIWS